MNTEKFFIVAYLINETGETSYPYAVRRVSDNKLFQLLDYVSGPGGKVGFIDHILYDPELKDMRLCVNKTDEPGIPLSEAKRWKCLWTEYINGEEVTFYSFPEGIRSETFPGISAIVHATHVTPGKNRYDIDLAFVGHQRSRLYNVDPILLGERNDQSQDEDKKKKKFSIHNNSDAFRQFLREQHIDYTPAGHFTDILWEPGFDPFTLGEKWKAFKDANYKP